MEKELLNKIRFIAKKKKSMEDTIKCLDLSEEEIKKLIVLLNNSGESIRINNEHIEYDNRIKINEIEIDCNSNLQDIKLCLISDTHLASTFDRVDILNYIYEKCERKGIKHVFHSGDIVEGYNIKGKDNSYLVESTYEGQYGYVCQKYPKFNGKTYLINGNHDLRWLSKDGKNVAKDLSLTREDFIYLGDEKALVTINGMKMMIIHNKSHDLMDTSGVSLIQQGHMHYSDIYIEDNIPRFQTSSLIDPAPYLKRTKGVERSCWFLTISIDDKGNIYYITKELEKFEKEKKLIKTHN